MMEKYVISKLNTNSIFKNKKIIHFVNVETDLGYGISDCKALNVS